MELSTRKHSALTLCSLGACCALAAVVVGAPLIDTARPLNLPNIGSRAPIWPPSPTLQGPSPTRIAAKVAITTGKAKIVNQANTQVAMVPAGFCCVLEGDYAALSAEAVLAYTVGSYDTRGPCDSTGPDMALGDGTLAFAAGAPHPFSFYGAQSAAQRLVELESSGGTASLMYGPSNTVLLSVEAGDSSFSSRNVARYTADGPAGTTVTFALHEFTGPSDTYTGTAVAQTAGDTDTADLDGLANVRLKLTHTGSSGTVSVTAAGCTPHVATLAPGDPPAEFVDLATGLSWTYSVAGCSVSFEVQRVP